VDHALQEVFGVDERLSAASADAIYHHIDASLKTEAFRPRALFERFNIEAISTTESAIDDLKWHKMILDSGWNGKVVTAYRPDAVIDPDFDGFADNVAKMGEMAGEDATIWDGYLAAHRNRRAFFKSFGATSSDHGHPTARTEDLPKAEAAGLFDKALQGKEGSKGGNGISCGVACSATAPSFTKPFTTDVVTPATSANSLRVKLRPSNSSNTARTLWRVSVMRVISASPIR
jgi:glucuronate isomerase